MITILIILLLFFSTSILSAEQPIKLVGKVEVSIVNGTLDAEFQLQNIPRIKDYLIFLNTGLNVQYFRNEKRSFNYKYNKIYERKYSEESFGYYFNKKDGDGKFLPTEIDFKYVGKFPVIADMEKADYRGDWKGNIAFNGKTIRTDGFQTAWYPIIYDLEQDKLYDEVTYDIEVVCRDCRSIYVNGSKPISATKGIFKRSVPTSIVLFAGNYDIGVYKRNYYLNSRLTQNQMSELDKMTSTFVNYYEDKIGLPELVQTRSDISI